MTARVRAAATAAALVALLGLVGAAGFALVHDDAAPLVATTTTTTTLTRDQVATAIALSLREGLDVALTGPEAACVTEALLAVVEPDELEDLATLAEPVAALDAPARDQLVRGIVACVPPATAAALLQSSSTTTVPLVLPDEGS